jgi:ATP-dependent DNA helicase RecG
LTLNLNQLLAGESLTQEFKSSFDKTTVETLVAFANAQGGTVISVADIQSDNYRSSLRNKLVAEAFYLTGSIEKYGSGFIRIRKALRGYPEIEFEIKEFAGGVMATFAQRGGANNLLGQSQPESLAERVLQILADGAMAKKDISDRLGQKEVSGQLNKTVRDLLAVAKIEPTIPDKPNSRHQKYRLAQAEQAQTLNQKIKH